VFLFFSIHKLDSLEKYKLRLSTRNSTTLLQAYNTTTIKKKLDFNSDLPGTIRELNYLHHLLHPPKTNLLALKRYIMGQSGIMKF